MSATEKKAYRATDPEAVRASLDRWQEERKAFFDRAEQFAHEQVGPEFGLQIVGNGRGMWANHLTAPDGHSWGRDGLFRRGEGKVGEIPEGWHFYVSESEVRPYRGGRDKASKAAVKALADLNATSPGDLRTWLNRQFDVPLGVFGGFGFEPVGDTFYVLRGASRFESPWAGNEHFEEVPMSTYWLDREAADEAA